MRPRSAEAVDGLAVKSSDQSEVPARGLRAARVDDEVTNAGKYERG
jgi:hypothetical protein